LGQFGLSLPIEAPLSAAFSLAAERLAGRTSPFEFLPPRVSRFQALASRYASGKLRAVAGAGAAVGLLVGGLFLYQEVQLWRLNAQWNAMREPVGKLEVVQGKIRQFRPWHDESSRTLSILRQLTMAFPEDGVVTAKTVEIREPNLVTCSGVARDNQSLLKTLDRLRGSKGVADLKVSQIRGRAPLQFTFDFRWTEGLQ
jgi:hypothetical protein